MVRKDERDIMFARMEYKPGTPQYRDYYGRHPEKKVIDDELRSRAELFSPKTPTFDSVLSPATDANFDLLSDIRHLCEGKPASVKIEIEPAEAAKAIKNLSLHYGAIDVKFTIADNNFYYSRRGRLSGYYGDEVDTGLQNIIVFLVEMAEEPVNTAPAISESVESSKAYIDAAVIGLQISYLIRRLGYNARCHMDGNYLLPMVPIAIKAGLGIRGRNGLLISHVNGCFVRIGAVTTDMPLAFDQVQPIDFNRFCNICRLCIKTCPAQTISESQNPADWFIDQEKCYSRWRNFGTDCGICISSCPIGQEISIEKIKNMTDVEIIKFIDGYKEKYGTRKRTQGKYFL